jgi:hypothetical protein
MAKEREVYEILLQGGEVTMELPARLSWEDKYRLKQIIDLIPDPPKAEEQKAGEGE